MSGQHVRIEWNGRRATAWLPDPLARRDFDLGADLARATERAGAAVVRVGDRLPAGWEPLARLLLRAEGVASSRIEQLRAPVAEVAAAEVDGEGAEGTAAWVADNLAVVSDALDHAASGNPLGLDDLHRWHVRLMRHGDLPPELVGHLRDRQGWIGGRGPQDAAFVPPPAPEVPALVEDLLAFVADADLDAVTLAAVVHAQFETIHPYGDGNGRIGRLLVLWVLARRLSVRVPPATSVLVARDPGGYLAGLHWFREDEHERWVAWFAHVVEASAAAALGWSSEVDGVLDSWRAKVADMRADAAARRVVELLPVHPVLTADLVAAELGVSSTAARVALEQLVVRGVVEPYERPSSGLGRPRRWWFAPELADLVGGWA